jgi:hypothetical protein
MRREPAGSCRRAAGSSRNDGKRGQGGDFLPARAGGPLTSLRTGCAGYTSLLGKRLRTAIPNARRIRAP